MKASALDPRTNVWIRVVLLALAMMLVPIGAWVWLKPPGGPAQSAATSSSAQASPPRARTASAPSAVGRSLSGKVIDEGGAPMRGVAVRFEASTKESSPRTTTDDDGAFQLDAAPAASGVLVASRAGYVSARLDVTADGDRGGLTLTLAKAQPLEGQVVDGDGKGVAGAVVRCDPDGSIAATSGEEGRFELAAGADGCDAQAVHGDYGASETVHLARGAKNILVLPSPGGIAGVVVDERGQPITTYIIAVETFVAADKQSEGMGGAQKSINDPGGAFELTGLGRGTYRLTASAEGRPPARSDTIEVEAGRTTRGVRIRLDRGITISGVITDRTTKQPLGGVRVALDSVTATGANAIAPAVSGDDGSFSIDGVPQAPFSLRLSKSGYRDKITSLDGRGKTDLKTQIDLAPAGAGASFEMVGIGASLGQGRDYVSFSSVFPDGPADKSGALAGDKILRIDGRSAENFTVDDCIQRLRGAEGSTVSVTLGRGDKSIEVTMTRALIVR